MFITIATITTEAQVLDSLISSGRDHPVLLGEYALGALSLVVLGPGLITVLMDWTR